MRHLLYLFACGLLLTGCGKEPLNQMLVNNSTNNAITPSEKDYQMSIDEIYKKHEELVTFINELDAAYLGVNDKAEYLSVKEKTYTEGDPLIRQLWDDAYMISSRHVNSILEMIYKATNLTSSFKERSIGQLLAVRGYIYLQLTLWYGKAPLVLKLLDPSDFFYIPEKNRNTILAEVIADFETALFYYSRSEFTYMKREEIRQYLIQAYSLKGELSKVASVLKNENISDNAFYTAMNSWLAGEEKEKVMDTYKSTYTSAHNYAAKLLLNTMEYDQTYFGWPDNHLAIFPIPLNEVQANQGVTQNPGY